VKAHIGAEITSLLACTEPGKLIIPRLPLLCTSREGYRNLCRLITRTKLRAPKYPGNVPRSQTPTDNEEASILQSQAVASAADLAEYATGLICLTGGDEGPLAQTLARGGMEASHKLLEQLIAIYGRGNVYVELQRHYNRAQEARNQAAIELARRLHLPLLATQGAQYAKPEERQILDVFTCIRNHHTLDTAGRLLARNSERYLKSPEDAATVCRLA
jgi:error-prone DNA polymerase